MISYTIAKCNSTDKFTIEDFIPLLIDETQEAKPEITEDRKEELFEIARQRAAILNKNK